MVEALKKEGGLWNRWEVLAMSINQSQPRMRLHPILLHSRFHQKPAASPGFSGCSVLASLRRVLQVAREACSTPEPRICAESSPSFGFLSPFFLLTKTTTCPPSHTFRETFIVHIETFRETLETFRETFIETPTPPSPHRLGPPVPAGLSSAFTSIT